MPIGDRLSTHSGSSGIAAARSVPRLGWVFRQAMAALKHWIRRSRARHALGELDDHLLRDIGVTRAAAAREAAKPFWRH
jgi:uncharacterized protein YjiS (DUF1127 family)